MRPTIRSDGNARVDEKEVRNGAKIALRQLVYLDNNYTGALCTTVGVWQGTDT